MPAAHAAPTDNDPKVYLVHKNGTDKPVQIMQRRPGEVFVHFLNTDKRMDDWVPESECRLRTASSSSSLSPAPPPPSAPAPRKGRGRHARVVVGEVAPPAPPLPEPLLPAHPAQNGTAAPTDVVMTEEDLDVRQHKQLTAQRNFDVIVFDSWKIKPWYYSPYPQNEDADEEIDPAAHLAAKMHGIPRSTLKSHGRTSDLLAGALLRPHAGGSTLWVCHFCFKYMWDGVPWELHKNNCKVKHPPGRKVYQRGAHMIWEVDGAKEKLYCQNLALFGKLFIDVKTLYYDLDNFLFYILTDAKSTEDHIMGFFSKEKLSYDDYNLACIMTLPQYQRKGYGMLLIEFSYELSRRAGKVGTPERPLSDLGLRSYMSFWISTLLRFFRRVLTILPPEITSIKSIGNLPSLDGGNEYYQGDQPTKKRKKPKGFDGEFSEASAEQMACMTPFKSINNSKFTSRRTFETLPQEEGGIETHVEVQCTLAEIAEATNLRVDDAAFALNECGLLIHRFHRAETDNGSIEVDGRYTVLINWPLVNKVAKERKLKRMFMDPNAVML